MSTINSDNAKKYAPGQPASFGPVRSQSVRHAELAATLHKSIEDLTAMLQPILSDCPETAKDQNCKAVPSCILVGEMADNNDSLARAVERINSLYARVQL